MRTPSPPIPDHVRTTITMAPEVHAAFMRLAQASGISLSRAIGEWLGDMIDAVQYTALKVEEARSAPKMVMREMHAYALGLADETGSLMQRVREKSPAGKRSAAGLTPASNTGSKSPGRTRG